MITGTITNNLRFPGQYYGEETGLHYNYFRDYQPMIGRYVEADPIGIKRGENHLYVYVGNRPIVKIDQSGLGSNDGAVEEIIRWCGEWLACNRARGAYCHDKFGDPCRAGCGKKYDPATQEEQWRRCLHECSINEEGCLSSSKCPYKGIKVTE